MIALRHAELHLNDQGCWTRFADGSGFGARPHDTPHYHVIAHRCGYEGDVLRYCREHELAHLVVEEWLFDRPSRILWGLAHGCPLSGHDSAGEEMLAQALQRFARAAERPIVGGVDWDGMRAAFRKYLKQGD